MEKIHTADQRLERALHLAGLNRRKAVRLLARRKALSELPPDWAEDLPLLVRLAELLDCDPRWLALGRISRAGEKAVESVQRALAKTKVTPADRDKLLEFARMTAEPEGHPGVCRYCGCTDEMGCGDCVWVDEGSTICSTCLIEER
ncbi:MAG: hypothetical protein AB7O62_00215 [Pirellulales bacterium]